MRLLQILLMGAAVGILFGVFTLMVELAILMMQISSIQSDGGGGLGATSFASWAPVTTIAGFVLGAFWQYRRTS